MFKFLLSLSEMSPVLRQGCSLSGATGGAGRGVGGGDAPSFMGKLFA